MAEATGMKNKGQGMIVREFTRTDPSVIQSLSRSYSGFILDRLGKQGVMHPAIKPIRLGTRFCGSATTCLGPDLSVRRMAIDLAQSGDVLVVAANGMDEFACFGDGTARRMMLKGLNSAVIDGATRDSAALRALDFVTFCRGTTPRNYHYPVSPSYGGVNVPVVCGGVLVRPGDVVFGDDDGVVVIPQELAAQVAMGIEEAIQNEVQMRVDMREYVPFNVSSELINLGYKFV
jgi:4-hydroxy-4-methyl-2-oxoglutarate aldolase